MPVCRGGEDFADTVNGLRLSSHYTVDDQWRKAPQIDLNPYTVEYKYSWKTEHRQ